MSFFLFCLWRKPKKLKTEEYFLQIRTILRWVWYRQNIEKQCNYLKFWLHFIPKSDTKTSMCRNNYGFNKPIATQERDGGGGNFFVPSKIVTMILYWEHEVHIFAKNWSLGNKKCSIYQFFSNLNQMKVKSLNVTKIGLTLILEIYVKT